MKMKFYLLALLFCFSTSIHLACDEQNQRLKINMSEYKIVEAKKNEYRYSDNWDDFIHGTEKLKIGYKIKNVVYGIETCYISELVYFIQGEKEVTILGKFSKEGGFQDAFGKEFLLDDNLKSTSEFMKKYFLGFPLSTLDNPFFIRGVAITTDNKKVFETEVITRIEVNHKIMSVAEYILQW